MALPIALRFAYDGACVDSYARQPDRDTVESRLMEALGHEGLVPGSWHTGSRTDRHVSALGNVGKAVLAREHLRGLVPALNAHLDDGVWATGAARVDADWNPRRASWRRYGYVVPSRGEDEAAMAAACRLFLGRHDMRGFARMEPGRDPVREVQEFSVAADGSAWAFRVQAPNFLWNQVRRVVDAALRVGRGEVDAEAVRQTLASGTPHPCFQVAPAEGLVLERVHYDGLQWDPQAGNVGRRRIRRPWMAARARLAVLEHLLDGA